MSSAFPEFFKLVNKGSLGAVQNVGTSSSGSSNSTSKGTDLNTESLEADQNLATSSSSNNIPKQTDWNESDFLTGQWVVVIYDKWYAGQISCTSPLKVNFLESVNENKFVLFA